MAFGDCRGLMRDALRVHAELRGDRRAVVMADGSAPYSYADLDRAADGVAAALRGFGLVDGDTVALLCENHSALLALWWGARRAGVYYVPLATRWTATEIAQVVTTSDARIVAASADHFDKASRAVAESGVEAIPVLANALLGTGHARPSDIGPRLAGREMIFSSGTTGRPKGIRRPLAPVADVLALPPLERRMREVFHLGADTVYLSVAPLHHATGRFLMRVVEEGGTVVILSAFDPAAALAAIERHRVTNTQWVPTMFGRLLALSAAERERHDLTSHRHALHAAAPCPEPVKRAMIDWWGPIVDEYYGGTENAGVTFIAARDWLDHPGSVGRSITGAIHITDEQTGRRELAPHETGRITFEGGVPFTYLSDETEPGAGGGAGVHAGYGDLGHVDERGYLYISDRRTDLIVSGGVNISPREVERVLEGHPAIAEVAVVSMSDADLGQAVRAVVVLRPDARASAAHLDAFARDRLSSIKCPRRYDVVDELPRNENDKLLKRVLREE